MTRPSADLVKVTWTGQGQGTMTLGSTVAGFIAFPAALDGFAISYSIEHQTSSERESGIGIYTHSGTTLTRELVSSSTSGGSLVVFSAGTKHVRITALALDIVENRATIDPTSSDNWTLGYISGRSRWLNTASNTLWFCINDGRVASPAGAVWGVVTSASGFAPLVHTHSLSQVTDAGALAAASQVAVTGAPVAVGDLTAMSETTHGFLAPNGVALQARYNLLRNATTQSLRVIVTVPAALGRMIPFFVADDQTGQCIIHRPASTLGYDGIANGPFVAGTDVIGGTSGARGTIFSLTGTVLSLVLVTGTFQDNETLTSNVGSPVTTALVNGTITNSSILINGTTHVVLPGAGASGALYPLSATSYRFEGETTETRVLSGTLDCAAKLVHSNLASVVTGVSGTLTLAAHLGRVVVTTGNITIPSITGFHCLVKAGGAHTISFDPDPPGGSPVTTVAGATGQLASVMVQSGTFCIVSPWTTQQTLS